MREKVSIIVLIIVVILLLLKGCQIQKDRDNLLSQVSDYKLGEKAFKTKLQKDSSTIATQSQTILTIDEALRLGVLKLDGEIKKAQSQVRQSQKIVIDSVLVPYQADVDTSIWVLKGSDNCPTKYDSLLANSVIVPKEFKDDSKWFKVGGKVQKNGVLIDSVKIENESSVTIGYKNKGFLGLKKEPIVEIKNTNPYLQVTKMDNVVIKKNKRLIDSRWLWMGLGVLGGIFIQKL
jgi:hypothetical protein